MTKRQLMCSLILLGFKKELSNSEYDVFKYGQILVEVRKETVLVLVIHNMPSEYKYIDDALDFVIETTIKYAEVGKHGKRKRR